MDGIISTIAVALVASVTFMAIVAILVIIAGAWQLIRTRGFHKYPDADKVEQQKQQKPEDPTCGGFFTHPYWTNGYEVLTND